MVLEVRFCQICRKWVSGITNICFLPLPNRSTEVKSAIVLHFTTPTLLLDSSMPSWESPLKHLDVADVLDITTVFSLEILHSAVRWIRAR